MPTTRARTADDVADNIRLMVDRMVDAKVTQEVARRGQELAGILAERGSEVGLLANDAWRDTAPTRRRASRQMGRTTHDLAKWSDRTWRKSLRPMLRDMWKQRRLAMGAAAAAIPAGREVVDEATSRLGLRRREERHWGSFFLGLLIGAAAGAIVALLTTPKRGTEMRHDLGAKADELATKARDEWVPIFQRGDGTNGHAEAASRPFGETSASLQEGAAGSGATSGEAAGQAAADTAEAINESFDTPERQAGS